MTTLTNCLLTSKNSPSTLLLNQRKLFKRIPHRNLCIPLYVLKEIAIIWTVFNLLQCIFGLFCSALNTYNLKSLLGPNITLAKIITSGFFGVFSQTIFHVLQSDSTQNKPPSPKRRRRHSISSCTPHSHNELNLLHKKFENLYKKSSSPAHNNSNEHNTSPLLNSIYQCYETPIDSRTKADFQSLHLHTVQPNKRKRSRGISLSQDLFENDSDYQEIPKDLLFNLPRGPARHKSCCYKDISHPH